MRFSDNVEYLPANVVYEGRSVAEYFIANPHCEVKAVDHAASSIELDEIGLALEVDHLVLDEARLAGHFVCMIYEIVQLAVHEDVASAIRAAGITGCQFVDPSSVRF